MTDTDSIDAAVAENLRRLLSRRSWRHDDLAREMAARGFNWMANTVTQMVTLRRHASLLEMAGLCNVFSVTLSDLIQSDRPFSLPSGRVGCAAVWLAFVGHPMRFEVSGGSTSGPSAVERKAMRSLGMSLEDLRAACRARLGQDSIEAERDRRVGECGNARSLQALRGHAMRSVIAELRS